MVLSAAPIWFDDNVINDTAIQSKRFHSVEPEMLRSDQVVASAQQRFAVSIVFRSIVNDNQRSEVHILS